MESYSIHKYVLSFPDGPCMKVQMPKGARLLDVQLQGSKIVLWALVSTTANLVTRGISVYGTGWDTPSEPGRYLATVQVGPTVWHYFDIGELT